MRGIATFTVIVPSACRPTLVATLQSIAGQVLPGDEIIVVCNDQGDFGNSARNSAIERASGSHLVFLDDDDEWLPDALARIRQFTASNPDRVGIFQNRIELSDGRILEGPNPPDLGSSGHFVVPNIPGKVGRFAPADLSDPSYRQPGPGETPEYLSVRFGDGEFIRSTLRLREDVPIWVGEVILVTRPEKSRWRRLRYRLRLRTRLKRLRSLRRHSRP